MIADKNKHVESSAPTVSVLPIPAFEDNYIWRIGYARPAGRPMLVVDPGDAEPVIADLEAIGSPLAAILVTHWHPDHVGGIQRLKQQWPGVRVIGPASCIPYGVNEIARHGDRIQVASVGLEAEVIATPGHTADHLSYFCPRLPGMAEPALFCGDTLFGAGCGRIFDGTIEQQFRSLTVLTLLPMETLVFAAHEYTLTNLHFACQAEPHNLRIQERLEEVRQQRQESLPTLPSTIAREISTNPFLRSHLPALARHLPESLVPESLDALSVFQALRIWRNHFRLPD